MLSLPGAEPVEAPAYRSPDAEPLRPDAEPVEAPAPAGPSTGSGTTQGLDRNDKMIIDQHILNELTASAKASPRLRMNLDLRNSPTDGSQRMLNAIEPGTVMPIHRHRTSSETVVCLRGHFEEFFYDADGRLTDTIDMVPGGTLINIPAGQWHSLESLESGTVLLECKDGPWTPLADEDVMSPGPQ